MSILALGFLAACGAAPQEDSAIKITNGMEIPNTEFPSVVLLYDADAGSICTGTFISDSVVLTAAHCSMSGRVDAAGNVDMTMRIIEIVGQENREAKIIAESIAVMRDPAWDRAGRNVNRFDLGLVFFEPGTSSEYSEISSVPARSGDEFIIVGFGINSTGFGSDSSSAGIKRMGQNRVNSLSGGFIQFAGTSGSSVGNGQDSAAGSGDSGGPMFIDGKIAGVTSGGGWGGFGRTRSLYVDLHSASSKQFLKPYITY